MGTERVVSIVTRFARGGSERRLLDALGALDDAEHIVVVGHGSDADRVRDDLGGLEVHWCEDLRREISPAHDLRALAWLTVRLRAWQPDLVFTHQSKAGQLGRVAAGLSSAPVVHSASMATFGPGYPPMQDRLFRWVEWLTAPLVDQYVCVGHDLARRLVEGGMPAERISVVRSSIEPRHLDRIDRETPAADVRARVGPASDGLVIGYVGSLEERKGVLRLPEILRMLRERSGNDVGLVVAGDGPLAADLSAAVASSGSRDHVALLGHVRDVGAVMRAVDVLVLPSSAEGLPQVLVQAMAWGTPFVSYSVDGVDELLGLGVAGLSVPLGDDSALVGAVLQLTGEADAKTAAVPRAVLDAWRPERVRADYREALAPLL